MESRRYQGSRNRSVLGYTTSLRDTALTHNRLSKVLPLELHAHISRVVSCAVISGVATMSQQRRDTDCISCHEQLCVASGDAVGSMSLSYFSLPKLCANAEIVDGGSIRPRVRPHVKFRGAHRGSINCMHHIKGATLLLTGGDDGAVRLWDVHEDHLSHNELRCVREFLFHSSCVLACDSDPSQTFFATTGLDGIVALWLLDTPIPLLTITVGEPCTGVSVVPEDPSLIHVAHQDQVSVWGIHQQPHYIHFQRALVRQVGSRLSGAVDATLQASLARIQQAFPDQDTLTWLEEHGAGERCLSRVKVSEEPLSHVAREFDEVSRRYVHAFRRHHRTSCLLGVVPTHHGRAVLTSSSDFSHKLWNLATRQGISSFEPVGHSHRDSDAQPEGSLAAAGVLCHEKRFLYGSDSIGGVHVWDLRATVTSLAHQVDAVIHPIHSIQGHDFFVTSIALSPDSTVLVTGDSSGKLHVRIASA